MESSRGGKHRLVRDALLLVDVLNDFLHEDGEALLASFRERHDTLRRAIRRAHEAGVPVAYANDPLGVWDGDVNRLVRRAVEEGKGGDLVAAVAPEDGDLFVVKPRYSAFDSTPLEVVLRGLEVERILVAGSAAEMCVVQTAIDAREVGFKVSILAEACSSVDPRMERLALEYAEAVVGAPIQGVDEIGA
ncbi:MAG TPA: isochorismatase family cysteine hydrolase [Gaiellaceae bacterium]|jgi:nicotinamidase-related amidase